MQRHCSVGTQRTALNALVFLYKHHLGIELPKINFRYARRPRRAPTVFSHNEALAVIQRLEGIDKLIARILYGSGLRISEALRLRVKDLDFSSLQITMRDGKGGGERFTLLARSLVDDLKIQIRKALKLHAYDLSCGHGEVYLPDALARKYPTAATSPAWQFLFPAATINGDPQTGVLRRHHRH